MSEEIAFPEEIVPPDELGTPSQLLLSVGQQLRAARDARGLAVTEVAKVLKLSPRQVEALEADDWPSLPCKTIIRGFVRNYARLLNLDSGPLMRSLDEISMPPAPELEMLTGTPVSIAPGNQVDRRDYLRVFSGLLILALAIFVTFFFTKDMWESTVSAFKAAMQPNETAVEQSADESAATVLAPPAVETLQPATAEVPEAAAAPLPLLLPTLPAAADVSAPATMPEGVLKFSFAQASWVEVRDRDGAILFSQLGQAGSQRDVEGRPPFALIIGNAGNVSLQYKGKPVDLSKRSKDDVARLSIE